MNQWPKVRLGDHCDLLTGYPFESALYSDDHDAVRVLRGDNVGQGYLRWDGAERWPEPEARDFAKFTLRPGDVILAMDRPWIEAGLKWAVTDSDLPCLLVQRASRLRGANGLTTEYLSYVIASQSFTDYVRPIVTGIAVPHLSGPQIQNYAFRMLPVGTQRRIASILSAYDDLIENNMRRIKILEEMAQSLYKEWFVDFRFPGHDSAKMVDSPLGMIPEGWRAAALSEIVKQRRCPAKPGMHLSDRHYVPIECLPRRSLAIQETRPWTEAQSSLQLFEKGDILFGAMRPYFHKVVVAPFSGITRSTCFVLRAMKPELQAFAVLTLFRDETVAFASTHTKGATIPYAVWDGSLAALPVCMADEKTLSAFADLANPLLESVKQSFGILRNLRQTRDLLLPKLISGEIDVSDLDIDVGEDAA